MTRLPILGFRDHIVGEAQSFLLNYCTRTILVRITVHPILTGHRNEKKKNSLTTLHPPHLAGGEGSSVSEIATKAKNIGKNYGSVSTAARLSKPSFPRYATSLATNAMRSPDPCSSHTPHGARHTHVSDHRKLSLDLPDLANSAALPLAPHIH
jgi:hypothetical protein